jgi:hypothetical protein
MKSYHFESYRLDEPDGQNTRKLKLYNPNEPIDLGDKPLEVLHLLVKKRAEKKDGTVEKIDLAKLWGLSETEYDKNPKDPLVEAALNSVEKAVETLRNRIGKDVIRTVKKAYRFLPEVQTSDSSSFIPLMNKPKNSDASAPANTLGNVPIFIFIFVCLFAVATWLSLREKPNNSGGSGFALALVDGNISPSNTPLSKEELRVMAENCDLFKKWKINPQLTYLEGDISYWHKQYSQGLSPEEICLQFKARQKVLEKAEKERRRIEDQGDLSHRAEEFIREGLVRKEDGCK